MFYKLGKRTPQKAENVFVADNAKVIGSVSLEEQSSVWFGVVIRGDNDQITVGPQSNVQDNAVLHTDGGIPLTIGRGVTVGHHAMLHGCTIGDYSLIGINAVVLNKGKLAKHCITGANALGPGGLEIPDRSLVVGEADVNHGRVSHMQKQIAEQVAAPHAENGKTYMVVLVA